MTNLQFKCLVWAIISVLTNEMLMNSPITVDVYDCNLHKRKFVDEEAQNCCLMCIGPSSNE